jgi:asparagine synthase (glutamine-hydrolysing)
MCGIAGWVSYDSDLTTRRPVIEAMTATMSARGPDAGGIWVRRQVALGHRRLSIIDLEGGVQPMTVQTPTGPVALVYSGETYNFVQLRRELEQRGHQFRTASDTEVVLRGYLEWGEYVAERLHGMFAFAVWDARDEKLVLIRDRMGIKPLYWYPTPDGVLFGSEPKTILANPLARKAIDADGIRQAWVAVKRPGATPWQGMFEVEPGTTRTVDATGIRSRTYWKLSTVAHTDDRETTVARVRELVAGSVVDQLVADVPLCVLLSGGLDSSAITAFAAAELGRSGRRVRTFSVDLNNQADDFESDPLRAAPDAPFVKEVAEFTGSDHRDIVLSGADLSDPALRRSVISARDMPGWFGDVDPSLYVLFRAVRGESTVALSGESADEAFGGYSWFHDERYRNVPMFPWILQSELFSGEESDADRDSPPVMSKDVSDALDIGGYLGDEYATAAAAVEHLDDENPTEHRMRAFSYVHLTRLLPVLLDRKDRMSMASGLEVRVPFCDHRLIEYVYNTPWAMKSFDGREKSLLRHATLNLIPRSVAERKKSGYPTTHDQRYVATLQVQAKQALADRGSTLFDLVDRTWLQRAANVTPATMSRRMRAVLDQLVELYHFLDLYRPELKLS